MLPADHDRLARLAQVSREELEAALPSLVDHIQRDGEVYRSVAVEKAIVVQEAYSEKQRQRVAARWAKHKKKRIPRYTAVSSGIPRNTEPYPLSTDTSKDVAKDSYSMSPTETSAESGKASKARDFLAGWGRLFSLSRGGLRYGFEGAKDGATVKAILSLAGGDVSEALRRAEVHLGDPYWLEHGASLTTFRSQWNRCAQKKPPEAAQQPERLVRSR